MEAVKQLCNKCILLENGEIKNIGKTETIIKNYLSKTEDTTSEKWENSGNEFENEYFKPEKFYISREDQEDLFVFIEADIKELNTDLTIGYALYNENNELLYWSYHTDTESSLNKLLNLGKNIIYSKIPIEILNNGKYKIEIIGGIHNKEWIFEPQKGNPTLFIEIKKIFKNNPLWTQKRPGILAPKIIWKK
jgi:lipopolysaccharide transport system ATP-binding protein